MTFLHTHPFLISFFIWLIVGIPLFWYFLRISNDTSLSEDTRMPFELGILISLFWPLSGLIWLALKFANMLYRIYQRLIGHENE